MTTRTLNIWCRVCREHPATRYAKTGRRFASCVREAPDKTMFTAATLAGPMVAVEGTIAINAVNGRLVYRITGVTDYGALLCEKIEDTLTPYVPEEWRPTV